MTEKLRGREFGALQTLFAMLSAWEVAEPALRERFEMAGVTDDAKQIGALQDRTLEAILRTVPPNKLRHIREELAHVAVYVRVEAPGIKTIHSPNYSYLPTDTLNALLNLVLREKCTLCQETREGAKKCEVRQLIETALPHTVGSDHGEYCMYSDMILGLGVQE